MILPEDTLHPAAPRLEAIAAGDDASEIAAHLESCSVCAAYVARLKEEAATFRAQANPIAFAEVIHARAQSISRRRGAAVAWVLAPTVAAAAAILLWLRVHPDSPGESTSGGIAPGASSAPTSGVARFKGGLAVAVIRERGQRQERLTGPFKVQPSDRIRVEMAVDHEGPVTAGLMSMDGTWTVLQAPVALSAGTHYSDLAARFDDTPTDALLVVGTPADVERARRLRHFEGVVAWHVTSASPMERDE